MAASTARIRIQSPAIGEKHVKRRPLANKEKIGSSYLARILRLTLLAPDIVEAILDGRTCKSPWPLRKVNKRSFATAKGSNT